MKRIFITGVAGYIGNRLAAALADNKEVEYVAGLDVKEPGIPVDNLIFLNQDIRVPLVDILRRHQIDTVIHTAWVVKQIHNTGLMEDINRSGTQNVMDSCAAAGVNHLIYTSSTTAYGFHPDNDNPLTEESPIRGNEGFTYGKNKREVENLFRDFISENPDLAVSILRPCFIVGPGFNNDMSEYLTSKRIMLPAATAPMQFVHEDDVIQGILHCLDTEAKGAFNLAGAGVMSFEEMAEIQGHKTVNLPDPVLNGLNSLLWTLRLSATQTAAFDMARFAWLASPDKFVEQTGFTYKYDTRSAFEDFIASTRQQ